ncbi:hypothetical protein EDEG_00061 [Edhazardia aedis USNM 41457]|uniref:Uncharacterized protein n=1 Tax=Edhazardia aedis (strain USNM 41457) TaxID=1003232 RepID=J9DBV4_EDHAE|nr:hypothetical protein EDEG_00061 [Edhazardia aedis USNM 41457]|eukprot:EJW05206.1 hypothetical protein EDEG_00061 [Edhazardia aedis USNM 41457]
MSKIIRKLRIYKKRFKLPESRKLGLVSYPSSSGQAKILNIVHERGRGAPLCHIEMVDTKERSLVIATEGNYIGQKIQIGNEDELKIGNCMPLNKVPEGTVVCAVERAPNDGGRIAVSSGASCSIIGVNKDANTVTLKMPSGQKCTLPGDVRAFIGIAAGGGRTEKPLLKAGRAYYKYKSKGIYWPRVRGVAMNPVDHPHGGGNHQHIGHPSTVSKNAPPGQQVGQIGARRTGLRKGAKKVV